MIQPIHQGSHLRRKYAPSLCRRSPSPLPGSLAAAQTVQPPSPDAFWTDRGAVPNAAVLVKNIETNQVTQVVTDRGGLYTALYLRPGNYAITVEAPDSRSRCG
jgi:hypothetical protein